MSDSVVPTPKVERTALIAPTNIDALSIQGPEQGLSYMHPYDLFRYITTHRQWISTVIHNAGLREKLWTMVQESDALCETEGDEELATPRLTGTWAFRGTFTPGHLLVNHEEHNSRCIFLPNDEWMSNIPYWQPQVAFPAIIFDHDWQMEITTTKLHERTTKYRPRGFWRDLPFEQIRGLELCVRFFRTMNPDAQIHFPAIDVQKPATLTLWHYLMHNFAECIDNGPVVCGEASASGA